MRLKKILITLGLIGIMGCFSRENSPKIELKREIEGTIYKNYLLNRTGDTLKIENLFGSTENTITQKDFKSLIDIDEKNQILQGDNKIYLYQNNELKKSTNGVIVNIFSDGYIFKTSEKYGFLDKDLNIVIPPQYEMLYKVEGSQLFGAMKGGKLGYVDKNNKIIIPFEYQQGASEKAGIVVIKGEKGIDVINLENKKVFENIQNVFYIDQNNFIVVKDKKIYHADKTGRLTQLDIGWAGAQSGDRVVYEKDNKFGLMDITGKKITENIYDRLATSYDKLIIAVKDEKCGLIDRGGKVVTELKYDYILPLSDNYFKVGSDERGLYALINPTGKIVTEFEYDELTLLGKNTILGTTGDKTVLLDANGKVKEKIDKIVALNKELIIYQQNGKNYLQKLSD